MTSPFAHMASVLSAAHMPAWNIEEPKPKGLTRTEKIRWLLRSSSHPVTAAEIAFDMEEFPNFGSHLVWLLLKYDIQKGRVTLNRGRYSWNHAYDTAEAAAIRKAVKLLTTHGYKVKAPQI
jgi:hypothetical protein